MHLDPSIPPCPRPAPATPPRPRDARPAFSLVELLVSIGILAVLIGILIPAISRAGASGRRIACRAQLADLGRFFQMYLNDSRGRLPHVNPVPSLQPRLSDAPSIVDALSAQHRGDIGVFRCPADRIANSAAASAAETYFEREGTSYLYNPQLAAMFGGRGLGDTPLARDGKSNLLTILRDFEPFHARPTANGSLNHLFADWHVGDLAEQ